MLGYEWENLPPIMQNGAVSQPDQNLHIFDHYSQSFNTHLNLNTNDHLFHHTHNHNHNHNHNDNPYQHYQPNPTQIHPHFASVYPPLLEPEGSHDQTGFMLMPKTEPGGYANFTNNRIGLNLGVRTYFSGVVSWPRCQAEGCNADLTTAKHYHRRHKVCEFHSKTSTVVTAGLTQRFCQQCSRFHLLTEFDDGKRSCRRRLADHNRRRRKSSRKQDHNKSLVTITSTQSSSSEFI